MLRDKQGRQGWCPSRILAFVPAQSLWPLWFSCWKVASWKYCAGRLCVGRNVRMNRDDDAEVVSGTMAVILAEATKKAKEIVPVLSGADHKGLSGRVVVVGGSETFTGAPYFAGMAAMLSGVDIVHVLCERSAAIPIKCYSPELIVHPGLDQVADNNQGNEDQDICKKLPYCNVVVVGPGLGTRSSTQENALRLVDEAMSRQLPLVIDADGLRGVFDSKLGESVRNRIASRPDPQLIIFTPNRREYDMMCQTVSKTSGSAICSASDLARRLGDRVVVLKKGEKDIIASSSSDTIIQCDTQGSFRRCGGQGDVLSGVLAAFCAWYHRKDSLHSSAPEEDLGVSIAFASAHILRIASRKAFELKGRSMLASDVLSCVPEAFHTFLS